MRNVVGRPVQGANFVGRANELKHAWELLKDNHLLLSAPRRVGKTSLMHRLRDEARNHGWAGAAYLSVAGKDDEVAFVADLFATLISTPGFEWLATAQRDDELSSLLGRVGRIGLGPLSVELTALEKGRPGRLLEAFRRALPGAPPGRPFLILIDELPVLLSTLVETDRARAQRFLEWFWNVRQGPATHADPVRWVLAGSIGLAPLAARQGWSNLIADLTTLPFGAMQRDEARQLLDGLASAHRVELPEADREALLDRLGWPLPYFLQLAFARLHGSGAVPPGPGRAEAVVQQLCAVDAGKDFHHWWSRLDKELGPVNARAAMAVLDACAADPKGVRADLLRAQLADYWSDDIRERERPALMEQLEHDGYLWFENARWSFRSPLLREVWLARRER